MSARPDASYGAGNVPPEANKQGGLNEAPPAEQRNPKSDAPLTDGPIINEKGGYEPASYQVTHVSAGSDGSPGKKHTVIRTDR